MALPTCSQAFAEAERYLPQLLDKLCRYPCSRAGRGGHSDSDNGLPQRLSPALSGRDCAGGQSPHGHYNLYRELLDEAGILRELAPLLAAYATERRPNEGSGDFVVRTGVVKAIQYGLDFHASGLVARYRLLARPVLTGNRNSDNEQLKTRFRILLLPSALCRQTTQPR